MIIKFVGWGSFCARFCFHTTDIRHFFVTVNLQYREGVGENSERCPYMCGVYLIIGSTPPPCNSG